jgi:hypothetical protein
MGVVRLGWLGFLLAGVPALGALAAHPALDGTPPVARTRKGLPGDPLNLALVGTEAEVKAALLAAHWHCADAITFKSCLKIAGASVLRRPYAGAPISNLFVWGRRQDLAFEQPVGHDPRRRHHVHWWHSPDLDEQGRPLWVGSATFDTRIGFSRTAGPVTHHIAANVDRERDKLIHDLTEAGWVARVSWVEHFQPGHGGRNGGGDPYYTDGRLAVVVLAPPGASGPVHAGQVK